jgi:hypothetical protein
VNSESGAGPDDPNKETAAESRRKVAKTMLDGSLPQIPDSSLSSENSAASDDQKTDQKPKRVAKTMLEFNRPTDEEVIAASAAAEQNSQAERKVAKTMMEMSLPAQSDTLKQIKKVSKTVLDVDSLDAIGMAKALKEEQQKERRGKEEQKNVPVKVRKTLTQDRELPNLNDVNQTLTNPNSGIGAKSDDFEATVKSDDFAATAKSDDVAATAKSADLVKKAPKRTRGTERFVAKTMLDHSVLSEQLVKSQQKEKMKAAYIAQERANEPAIEFEEVDSKKMASPCVWTWTESGSNKGRVRACDKCQTHVYDFSGLEMSQAEALVFKHESKKKFNLYKRADGKFMTTDCPVQARRKRSLILICVVGALVVICAVALMLLMPPPPQTPAPAAVPGRSNEATLPGTKAGSHNAAQPDDSSSSNPAPSAGSSSGSSTATSGKMHFEAGSASQQNSPNPGLFPTVTATPKPTVQTNSPAPGESSSSTSTNQSTTTTTTSTGAGDKYWE